MEKTLIIAEAGVNHNGDIRIAKKLVDAAKDAGADIVKFQTVNLDKFITNEAVMADYQKDNIGKTMSQREMLNSLQLTYEEFLEVYEYCNNVGITFLSSASEEDSIKFLDPLQDMWKISSGLITDYPFLREISKRRKPILLSTGMSDLNEIESAINVLTAGNIQVEDITLLQCTTDYPAPIKDVNLKVMDLFRRKFGCKVGYSDHTQGIEIPIAAVAMGATVIEKHFTLDRNMEGPDHKASLEPNELKSMVKAIRNVELAIGKSEKLPSEAELKTRDVARKSIVARVDIAKGEFFSESNLITKRPGIGLSPMMWEEVIGKVAIRDFRKDELIVI